MSIVKQHSRRLGGDVMPTLSFFKLNPFYSGPCIKIRRDSDDTTLEIGFENDFLDVAAIIVFCGEAKGLIEIWYDQSSNANNAVSLVLLEQPIIYQNGSVITREGHVAMSIKGKQMMLVSNLIFTHFSVFYNELAENAILFSIPFSNDSTGTYWGIMRNNNGVRPSNLPTDNADYYKNSNQLTPETRDTLFDEFVVAKTALSTIVKSETGGRFLNYSTGLSGNIFLSEMRFTISTVFDQADIEQEIITRYNIT